MPPFTIELSPETPTAREAFEITVRFWDDAAHTHPARWPNVRRLDELPWFEEFIWLVPVGRHHPSAEAMPIELLRKRRGVYHASVVVSSPGRWDLCAFVASPCEDDELEGPGRLGLLVLDAPEPTTTPSAAEFFESSRSARRDGTFVPVAAAATLAVVLAGVFGVRRSRR